MKRRPGRLFRVARVFVLTLIILALLLIFDPDGLAEDGRLAAYPDVRELALLNEEPPLIPVTGTSQDFDGDGVVDTVSSVPRWLSTWWGTEEAYSELSVRSGRTGELLLEIREKQLANAHWFGDLDGNGTMDVVFECEDGWRVFGSVRP